MRLFIDEDLSPTLAAECHRAGYDATSVRDRGILQADDRQISDLCFEEDRVLVTNNADDFLALAEVAGVHPGLIFLPLGSREAMRRSMGAALAEIERRAGAEGVNQATLMVNTVVEVEKDGACGAFEYP
ncbi:MAG TPA: DUF5615 family PIN-like protein [Solirubrobacterales bacterium]